MNPKPPTAKALAARYSYSSVLYADKHKSRRGVFLRSGVATFKVSECDTKAEANWMRARIGEALARIVEENR